MLFESVSRLHARNLLLANETYVCYSWVPKEHAGDYTVPTFEKRLSKFHWEHLDTLPRRKVKSATSDSVVFDNGSRLQFYNTKDFPLCWVWCDDNGHAGIYMEWSREQYQARCNFYIFTQTLSETEFQKFRGVPCLTSTN